MLNAPLLWSDELAEALFLWLVMFGAVIALRRSEPCLRDGRLDCVQTKYDELEKWLVVERPFTTVVCNLGVEARPIPLPSGRRKMIMSSADVTEFDTVTPVLPPDSVAIFKRE